MEPKVGYLESKLKCFDKLKFNKKKLNVAGMKTSLSAFFVVWYLSPVGFFRFGKCIPLIN